MTQMTSRLGLIALAMLVLVWLAAAGGTGGAVTGDFDNDGLRDRADVDRLVAAIASGTNELAFDLTGDGIWNGNRSAGVAAWCSGDVNADGVVDVPDFNIWNGNKFTSSG